MFTIDQIKTAHSKLKSGAGFPAYIQEIIKLGVEGYETYVTDGHSEYYGQGGYTTRSEAKYVSLSIADKNDVATFKNDLKKHQQGQSDYMTFCRQCAEAGVEKWAVDMAAMTCTYYDKAGNKILVETVPLP